MEKLLLKFILSGQLDVNQVRLEYATNEQFFVILKKLISFYKKSGKTMIESDLTTMLRNDLNNVEFRKVEAYIQSAKDFPTDLSPKEVLHEAKIASLLRRAEGTLSELADAGLAKDKDAMLERSKELYAIVQASHEKPASILGESIEEKLFFIDSFCPSLNNLTSGLSGLTVIGAASGGAKSMFAINEVCHQWLQGNSSVFFSLEMSAALVEIRMLANLSGINLTDLLKSKLPGDRRVPLSPEDAKTEKEWKEKLKNSPHKIYIVDDIFDMDEITANIVSYKINYGISMVVIDYMNLASSRSGGESWAALARWTKELNQVAVENSVVIVSPTQIDVESNPDGSLKMRTRGSTELLNSASLAILLYRDEETAAAGMIALHITKVRTGTKGVIALKNELYCARLQDVGVISKETY